MTAPSVSLGGLAAWAQWVRETYVIDRTGEELLRLAEEADVRYRQARDVLNGEGLTLPNGRAHPAIAVERNTRAAIAQLISQLDLADIHAPTTTTTNTGAGWHRAG